MELCNGYGRGSSYHFRIRVTRAAQRRYASSVASQLSMMSPVMTTGRVAGGSQARSSSSGGRSRTYSVRTRGSVVEHPAQIIRHRALQILADMFIGCSEALDSRMGGPGGAADSGDVRG